MRSFSRACLCWAIAVLAIVACAVLPARAEMAVVAYWTFDDEMAIQHDSVGTDNGASNSGVLYSASGLFGGAADFGTTANDYYIALGSLSDFDSASSSHALSVWYKSQGESIAKAEKVFHISGGNIGTALSISGSTGEPTIPRGVLRPFARDIVKANVEPVGAANVRNGEWRNLSYVYDGTTQTVYGYVDGVLDCTATNAAIGTVSGFTAGRIGRHATSSSEGMLGGLLDDMAVMTSAVTPQSIALINGLGRLAAVDMSDSADILAVEAAFNIGPGGSAMAGGQTWCYTSGLGSTVIGTIGGSVAGGDAFIVLDASGNGVSLVPEPSTFALLAAGLVGLLVFARRKRSSR